MKKEFCSVELTRECWAQLFRTVTDYGAGSWVRKILAAIDAQLYAPGKGWDEDSFPVRLNPDQWARVKYALGQIPDTALIDVIASQTPKPTEEKQPPVWAVLDAATLIGNLGPWEAAIVGTRKVTRTDNGSDGRARYRIEGSLAIVGIRGAIATLAVALTEEKEPR